MEFINPCEKYLNSYSEAIKEYKDNNVDTYAFLNTGKDVFSRIEDFRTGNNLPQGYVKATYFWLVDNDEFIGEISVRHQLTEALMKFGGNIGYGVRLSQWHKGYGTFMLAKALEYAKNELGLKKVLITCNDDNLASVGVIEKNGGVLENKIVNVVEGRERLSRRYWIEL